MMEFEDAATERMAQLEQEDLERYQRDLLANSSYSVDDETPNYVDEFQSKLPVLLDMVRGIINNLKQTTFSMENGSDEVTFSNNSSLRYETTREHLSNEEFVVNDSPEAAEMLDLVDIKDDEFSNSEVVPDLKDNKVSEYGLKVLSIYCAHMAPKWKHVFDSQPIQGNDMSVEVYYDHFFNWKRKLEEVNYIGGEESYADDFIYGLEIKLGMRVRGYKWKPHTLYGAFRRAVIEESLMKNDAAMVFEEMPHPTSNDNQGTEDVSDVGGNVMLDYPLGREYTIKPTGLNEGNRVFHMTVLQVALGSLGDTTVNGTCNGSAKAWLDRAALAIDVVLNANAMKNYASICMVDVMPPIFRAAVNEQLMDNYTRGINSNQLTLFDPGGGENLIVSVRRGTVFQLIAEALEFLVDSVKGIDGLFMFIYDPGGCCLFYNGCDFPEFNVDHGGCCLDTIIAALRDNAVMYNLSIWIASLGGVIMPIDHISSKYDLDYIDSVADLYGNKVSLGTFSYSFYKEGDWQIDVPKLLSKVSSPSPTGLLPHSTLFSFVEDYYTDCTLRKACDCAPNVDKLLVNGLGEFYSSQNKGSRIGGGHQFLDEMLGSFTIKLEICPATYRHLWLSVAELLKYLGLATEFLSKLMFELKISFWLGMISMFVFYPGTGALEGQWNAYRGHVNGKCSCAVMILGGSNFLGGAMVHSKDDVLASLHIQGFPSEIAGRVPTYTEHMVYTLLSSNGSFYQNAFVQIITHNSFLDKFKPTQSTEKRCSDNELLYVGLMKKIGLDMSRSENFKLGLLLSDCKHFALYVILNDNDDVAIATLEDFIWDPGQSGISFYILEDKDVFKWVGKRLVAMVMIRNIRDGKIDLLNPDAMSETFVGLLIFITPRDVVLIIIVIDTKGHVVYAWIRLFQARNYLWVQLVVSHYFCFQLSSILVIILIKTMLRTSTWLHGWKCYWDGR